MNWKEEILSRFFVGLSMGVTIGYFVNICISLSIGGGSYLPVMPQLASHFARQIDAVIFQTVLMGIIGIVFAEASIVFKFEHWSLLKQELVHFAVTSVFYTPFIYLCYMPNSLGTVLVMVANFFLTYLINWFIQYRINCGNVRRINEKLQEARHDGSD